MDEDTKPFIEVFQHNNSITTETKPVAQTIFNMSLKRRLETDRPLTTPLKKLNTATLKRFEANANKSQASASIYAMNCDKFIEEIMNRPGIWDSNDINYKNKLKVKYLWEEIHQEFPSMPVDELKKRWKNLKDGYRKELKRIQIKRSEGDLDVKPSWRFFDQLYFLRDSFKFLPSDCKDNETNTYGLEASSQSSILLGSPKSVDEEEEEEEVENGYFPITNDSDIKAELLRMERKKMWILEEEIAKRNQYMDSDNYHFLMSLLPEMNKLGPVQKMRLRTKISQAVLEEVSSLCDNGNVGDDEQQPSPTLEELDKENTSKTHEQEIKEEIIMM